MLSHTFKISIAILILGLVSACNSFMKNENQQHTNRLINETSPYLLQHAHNPVDWYPWSDEALEKAQKEDKLLIISVGYSSCHWCHVMEHESFENDTVAKLMNEHFVSIKVDREERPDIDHIYMNAVQLMSGRGGWPLNCVALPDGRPIWGGTYFPSDRWMESLKMLAEMYETDREKVIEYAENLTGGIQKLDSIIPNTSEVDYSLDTLKQRVEKWKGYLDYEKGGHNRAPKFPIPMAFEFLLAYAHLNSDEKLLNQVELTADRMLSGGIYDQIGGGFARYSTDPDWKVPHFEKMLYDNAQLLSFYAHTYQKFGHERYADVIAQTHNWLQREMKTDAGGYYSALDADTEGEEGKYYVWSEDELRSLISEEEWPLFSEWYGIRPGTEWEGNFVLQALHTKDDFSKKHGLNLNELNQNIDKWSESLMAVRAQREAPGVDDKVLTAWNALLVIGYCDAYAATGKMTYMIAALELMDFLTTHLVTRDGGLYRTYSRGEARIEGYLEDYVFYIDAAIRLYEISGDESWLRKADQVTRYVFDHFSDYRSELFFMTSNQSSKLISRSIETEDNVIPSANSTMAWNLFRLARYFDNSGYERTAQKMVWNMEKMTSDYITSYGRWAMLYQFMAGDFYEVAISGEEAFAKKSGMQKQYLPHAIYAFSDEPSELPLLTERWVEGETRIYVCQNKSCQLPVNEVDEALKQLQ